MKYFGEKLVKEHMETREHLPRSEAAKQIVQYAKRIHKENIGISFDLETASMWENC